ncbi:retrovirus-related Pol polyprotein from transposon TNT 1-94 [Trichonephila clavipes]|nr:retrovirus-related Pol polyprotein from transposon TNT 1-94 [Trichonephila clavipes]
MGYAQRTKGYRIWLIDENKLVETINVRFDENKRGINFRQKVNSNLGYNLNLPDYYDDEDDSDRAKDSLTSRLVSKTSTETPSTSEKPDVSSDNHSLILCTEVKWIRNIGRKVTGSNVYYSIEGEATRLKSFNEIERYCKRHNIKYDPSLFNFRKDNIESQGFSDLSEQQEALMVEVTIPNCYKQAIRSRDASKWRDAMDKEINVMMERKVWDLVDHPDNIKILENRWVYTIKYTQEYKLELSKVKSLKLRCYSDSDFATNRDDRVSMGGFITFIDETPISWRTFKQKSVSLSTMEAEYVSLTEAAKEFIWLKNVIDNKSLNLELSENVMFCDNQAAISFSKSPVENCRTKHIDVRYHFLRNLIYDKIRIPDKAWIFVKRRVPLRHGVTLNSHRAASLLVRLVEGEERWETPDHPQGVLPHNWGRMEPNHTITCMVLKAKTDDRHKTSPLPSMNFVGLDLMLQSVTNPVA